jgi:hypothetical protein
LGQSIGSLLAKVWLPYDGKNKTLKIARFVGIIQGLEKVAVVVVKEKRKKPCYLVSTNLHLSALDVVKYYANRWKIEQMIKDLKQRLGLGNYLVRDPPSSCGLSLPQLFRLNPSEDPPFGKRKNTPFDSSIHLLAFYLRRLPGCPMDNLDHRLSPKSL